MLEIDIPVIPDVIVVHLGSPASDAPNIEVAFDEYIKNVASNEIYPTWDESALIANILAQISFTLNRIYTEYYRSRGYDFDITNDTAYDQSYVVGNEIFENISDIVNEYFNSYIRRQGNVEPLFASYCNGITSFCDGLSQWGSLSLAKEGNNSLEILKYYYGDDIEIVRNAPTGERAPVTPSLPLRPGDVGKSVRTLQIRLNRVSANYPSIPKIAEVDGIFGSGTENAVLEFQRIFGLDVSGIVNENTWYKLRQIYNGVKRLNEILSEGINYDEASLQFSTVLKEGDEGLYVSIVQYLLSVIAEYVDGLDAVEIDGRYTSDLAELVSLFQTYYSLPVTGQIDEDTYNAILDVYLGIIASVPDSESGIPPRPYPGYVIIQGDRGSDVETLQTYLRVIGEYYDEIPVIEIDGIFGSRTLAAVKAAQKLFGLEDNGGVDALTWKAIASAYEDVIIGSERREGQYPGFELSYEGEAVS